MNEKQTDYKCNCGAPKPFQQPLPKRAGESVRIEHDDPPDRSIIYALKELISATGVVEGRLEELQERLSWVRCEHTEHTEHPEHSVDVPSIAAPTPACYMSNLLIEETNRILAISYTINVIINELGI
jgi:pyruvate/oxaloacetate carboxyltransferase